MANHRYCIYCHTNKANGKKYIGNTRLNPLHRWGKDGNGYDKNNAFGRDIEKYGWNAFSHEILEYGIVDKKQADELERKYIKELNTIHPNGYNTEDGGIHGSVNPKTKKPKRPKTGWHHSEETKKRIKEAIRASETHPLHQKINRSKPVEMFDKDGTFLQKFYGAAEASRQTGVDVSQISKVCKDTTGRYKTAGGYIWKYSEQ